MSGHSKWKTIKHQKGAADAKRGQLFTKLARDIFLAIRQGGGGSDPDMNFRLRLALDKAKGEAEQALILIAVMCDQPKAFARKLTGWDFQNLGLIVARFFPQGMP